MASKGKAKKDKRRKKQKRKYRKLEQRLRESGLLEEKKLLYEPRDQVKMSQVIIDFIEPYLDSVDTYREHDNLVAFAVLIWNTALLPQNEQKAMIREILGIFSRTDAKELKPIIEEMIERKKKYFSDNRRFIVEYDLAESKDGFRLSVVSTSKNSPTDDKVH